MRICYLAPASSSHMVKWCNQMATRGHECHVVSLVPGEVPDAEVHVLATSVDARSSDLAKLSYLTRAREASRLVEAIRPDVIHAHYATSYGLLAALAVKKRYWLSVWGSDVYDFPKRSPAHTMAVRYALSRASWLMSTSRAMAVEASKYTGKPFEITPFGVDMELFNPFKRTRPESDGRFVVGTVKALEKKYGIDCLLRGAARVRDLRPDIPLEVRIAGRGGMETELKELANSLGIADRVTWLGFIPQEQAAIEWANLDVAVVMSESESESFGVSAVEAQASGVPIVYSDIPGLMEACGDGGQGICLPRRDHEAVAQELIALYDDPTRLATLARAGQEYVRQTYEVNRWFDYIEELYPRHTLTRRARGLCEPKAEDES